MRFGKIVVGIILAGLGVLLLANSLGYLPTGVWPWLVKFWPYLLLAFGFALLANALKNVVIGVIAIALVVLCIAFGAFWVTLYSKTTKTEHRISIDLEKPPVRAVTVRARAVAGTLTLDADPTARHAIILNAHGVAGEEFAAHRWSATQGSGLLVWPARFSLTEPGLVGGTFRVGAPPQTPVRVGLVSYFAKTTVDLADLRPVECDVRAVGSSVRMLVGKEWPAKIRIHGSLSNVEIRLPPNCPARMEFSSPVVLRSLPDDFVKRSTTSARGNVTSWTAEGSGRPVAIAIEGPFMRVRVVREPVKAP
jgi:cell wall-active antibiotic response 4TMS protein YvqF